jgi:hypothetical protein
VLTIVVPQCWLNELGVVCVGWWMWVGTHGKAQGVVHQVSKHGVMHAGWHAWGCGASAHGVVLVSRYGVELMVHVALWINL